MNEAFKHPYFIARGMITEAKDSGGNAIQQINSAMPFKRESTHQIGKKLGADTLSIMQQLGYSDEQVVAFKKNRCI
ncbi:MAG: crotonobetainyl-CoA:carnitine CoA-transferase CaiB-like acyl-CoA transferase [Oleispira sp.]